MNSKFIAVLAVVIIIVAGVSATIVLTGNHDNTITVSDTEIPVYGNANNDLYIDQKDIDTLKTISSSSWDSDKYPFADANQDGFINDKDIEIVQKIIDGEKCTVYYRNYFEEIQPLNYPMSDRNIGVSYWQQAEMMAALGQWDNVRVGPNNLTAYYSSIYDLSNVDIYTAKSNHSSGQTDDAIETYVANDVDLIICTPTTANRDALQPLMDNGVDVIYLWYTGDWCFSTMMTLGVLMDCEEQAQKYMDYCNNVLNTINSRLSNTDRPDVIVAAGSTKLASDGVTTTVTTYTSPKEGNYFFLNLVADAYTSTDSLTEYGGSSRSLEWIIANDDTFKYIFMPENQTGFASGSADSGVIITQEDFNSRFESHVGTYSATAAYKNGNVVAFPYDMLGGISGYALLMVVAYMVYPDLFTIEEAQDSLQLWMDDFTGADVDVTKEGGYYYNGDGYNVSYL